MSGPYAEGPLPPVGPPPSRQHRAALLSDELLIALDDWPEAFGEKDRAAVETVRRALARVVEEAKR